MGSPPEMKSLLVIQPYSFDEIVHGLQVIQSLAWARPDCRISWVVSEEFAGLVEASPYVRETIVFSPQAGWSGFLALRRSMKIKMFDTVWDMAGVLRSGLLTSAVLSNDKWGRADARQGAGYFYKQRVALPTGAGPHHTLDILQHFLRAAGVPQRLFFPMELKPGETVAWESFFAGDPRHTFLLFTDGGAKTESWSNYNELTAFILGKIPESRVVWCAMKKAQPKIVVPADRFLNLTGCSLREMLTLVRQPATFIGTASGPMHLSAAAGNPVLALFGAGEPRRSGPYPVDAAKHLVVSAPGGQLSKLTPATVMTALEELRQRSL